MLIGLVIPLYSNKSSVDAVQAGATATIAHALLSTLWDQGNGLAQLLLIGLL